METGHTVFEQLPALLNAPLDADFTHFLVVAAFFDFGRKFFRDAGVKNAGYIILAGQIGDGVGN